MMKHLEESKVEESLVKKNSERKIVEKHSPTTPRLFLGKRTPDMPRRSKNSPRLLKASQQSLRSRKSESGILKNKESLSVDGTQRRAKSMEEISNNNACLSYNSGSDSDCCFDDFSLGKDVKVSADLRKRKPSIDNSCKNTDFNGNSCTDAEISRKSVKSKNSNPVLEIVDVGDSESSENNVPFAEPYVKSSGTTVKELIPLVKVTEPCTAQTLLEKSSEQQVKNPSPFEVSQDHENKLKNDGQDRSTKNEGRNRKSSGNMSHLERTGSKEKIGKGKQDKILKEDEGLKEADKKTEISKDQADKKLKKTEEEKKKKGLKVDKKLDGEKQEESVEKQSGVGQERKVEMNKSNDLKEKGTKSQDYKNEEKSQDVGRRGIRDDRTDVKDDQNVQLGSQNSQEEKTLKNAKDSSAETVDSEKSWKQTNDHKKSPFKELAKDKQKAQQDSENEIKSQKGKGTQDHEGLKVESQLDVMDNRSEKQDSEKDLSGTTDGSRVNPMDNTLGANQGSQGNLMDNTNQGQNSPEEISDTQPEGNTRTRFHGIRLEPLPNNVNKLTPPASNI